MVASVTQGGGTYIKATPCSLTSAKIANFSSMLNIDNPVAQIDLHVTVIYSETEIDQAVDTTTHLTAVPTHFDIFGWDKERCLVIVLSSNKLRLLHEKYVALGGCHTFPEYCPHVTLSYDYKPESAPDNDLLRSLGQLVFTKIFTEPIDMGGDVES